MTAAFRQAYGMTPSEYREQRPKGAGARAALA